jgi:hypothetical protein
VTQFADAPVEVSHIKRSTVSPSVIEGLGGTWRDRPWHMSLRNIIREIERPDSERQWDFFVVIDCTNVQTTAAPTRGRRTCGDGQAAHGLGAAGVEAKAARPFLDAPAALWSFDRKP